MWWSGLSTRAANIAVQITFATGNKTVYINQQLNAGQWNSLGQYYFASAGKVRITAAIGTSGTTCADAVKITSFNSNLSHTITATSDSNGSITPSGAVAVADKANQTFTMQPKAGYKVADVKVDGVSVGAVTTYTFSEVTADHTIALSNSQIAHTITATSDSNGSITPSGAVTVADLANQTFTMQSKAGYKVADVKVDGVSVGAVTTYTFTGVTADHTIALSNSQITHTITATSDSNGSITPSGAVTVADKANQTFTHAAQNAGYKVADVKVDGVSVGAVTTYTFQRGDCRPYDRTEQQPDHAYDYRDLRQQRQHHAFGCGDGGRHGKPDIYHAVQGRVQSS